MKYKLVFLTLNFNVFDFGNVTYPSFSSFFLN